MLFGEPENPRPSGQHHRKMYFNTLLRIRIKFIKQMLEFSVKGKDPLCVPQKKSQSYGWVASCGTQHTDTIALYVIYFFYIQYFTDY